jgi:cell division protein FtsQ
MKKPGDRGHEAGARRPRTGARGEEPGNSGLLRRIGAAVAGVAAAALLGWAAWEGYEATVSLPIQRVVYAGEIDRLAQADLDALAQAVVAAPSPSLEEIRDTARKVPWVREATVRRVFPDAVEIAFAAHTAFARWNDGELVSPEGEIFIAPDASRLPQLRGPDASAPQVVREYAAVAAALAAVGPFARLTLTPRGAWRATLESGLVVALGRGEWRARAERFVAAWPQLPEETRTATTHADLRYPGGFALKRTATVTLPLAPSTGRGK